MTALALIVAASAQDLPSIDAHRELKVEEFDPRVVYHYGFTCDDDARANADIMLCDPTCSECRRSWPNDDPDKWNSDENKCRCMPRQRAREGYLYGKRPCKRDSLDMGLCDDCEDSECRFSWPKDDPKRWRSDEKHCRCKPVEKFEYAEE